MRFTLGLIILVLSVGTLAWAKNEQIPFSVFLNPMSNLDVNRTYAVINGSTTKKFDHSPSSSYDRYADVFIVEPFLDVLRVSFENNMTGINLAVTDLSVFSSNPDLVEVYDQSFANRRDTAITPSKVNTSIINITCHLEAISPENPLGWAYVTVAGQFFKTKSDSRDFKFSFLKICSLEGISTFDGSSIMVALMALFTVMISMKCPPLYSENMDTSDLEIRPIHVVGFVFFGSANLVLVFYWASVMIVIYSLVFILMGYFGISEIFTMVFGFFNRFNNDQGARPPTVLTLPVLGEYSQGDIFGAIASLLVIVIYFATTSWVFSNIIAFGMVLIPLRLPIIRSFRVAIWLLAGTLLYDVFWVFLSGAYFEDSLMVNAAKVISLPIKFEVPWFSYYPLERFSMIGLGDIVIPGIVLIYLRDLDQKKGTTNYSMIGLFAYFLGLLFCEIAVLKTLQPQPALLYINPVILAIVLGLGYFKGEIPVLLDYLPVADGSRGGSKKDEGIFDKYSPVKKSGERRQSPNSPKKYSSGSASSPLENRLETL